MKILIVTGKLAADIIEETTKDLEHDVDVLALPVTVAAFITPAYAAKQLASKDLSKYDMILLPGSVMNTVPVFSPSFRNPFISSAILLA